MRISDWSSDVCSSDLPLGQHQPADAPAGHAPEFRKAVDDDDIVAGGQRGIGRAVVGDAVIELVDDQPQAATAAGGMDRRKLGRRQHRSEEHTSELQSLMRTSYAVFCLKKNKQKERHTTKRA